MVIACAIIPRIPARSSTSPTASLKKYMSQTVVVPARSDSSAASSVPTRTNSAETSLRSVGRMYL